MLKAYFVIIQLFGTRGFSGKKTDLNARGFAWEFLRSCSGYRPGRSVKISRESSSLHSKNNFVLAGAFFL